MCKIMFFNGFCASLTEIFVNINGFVASVLFINRKEVVLFNILLFLLNKIILHKR